MDMLGPDLTYSDEHFRAIFEGAPIGISLTDVHGRVIGTNHYMRAMLGYKDHELRAMTFMEFTHPDDVAVDWELLQETVAGKRASYCLEKRYIRKDGCILWVRLTVSLVRTPDGSPRFVMAMVEDISARKEAEEALRASEEQFRAIFATAAIGIALADVEGRIVQSNRAYQQMLGYTEEELAGMAFLVYTHPDDAPIHLPLYREMMAGQRDHFQLEKRYIRRDGAIRWGHLTASLLRDVNGRPQFSIAMVEDITDQKRAEQRLREVTEQKDAFLSALAHDIRTPLTTLKGRVHLLRWFAERGEITPEKLQTNLDRMEANITRMVTLTNEMLDVANLELGRPVSLSRSWIDLVALARRVVEEHQDVGEQRIALQATEPSLVGFWDPDRIERVLANLLSNAVKYSPDRAPITVKLWREGAPGCGWAVLAVRDQGIGIPSHDLPLVFDRFRRASNVSDRILGTGIGLATVREIVDRHGGTVTVESQEGVGSTFICRLPFGGLPAEGED